MNQYHRVLATGLESQTAQRAEYDVDGNLVKLYAAADMNSDGNVDVTDLGLFVAAAWVCDPNALYEPAADVNGDGCVDFADYSLLLAGYGQTNVGALFAWDAENRLTAWTPLNPAVGDARVEFSSSWHARVYSHDKWMEQIRFMRSDDGGRRHWPVSASRRTTFRDGFMMERRQVTPG